MAFQSEPGCDLTLKSLEARRLGIRLLNVRESGDPNSEVTQATVYVPKAASAYFMRKVTDYAAKDHRYQNPRTGEVTFSPKNAKLVASIADVRRAKLTEAFWTDAPEALPGVEPDWVEVWLSTEDTEAIAAFCATCGELEIAIGEGRLSFPERTVMLIRATRDQLVLLIEHSDAVAEFRAAREVAGFFIREQNRDQSAWVDHLLFRVEIKDADAVSVLILDHGVNNGHRLLAPLLSEADKHAVKPQWGTHDHHGHGTLMAGTAAYGDLLTVLQDGTSVPVTHCLESAQAWNALSVGAWTGKTRVNDDSLRDYRIVADAGNLSPFTTTSLTWPWRKWPNLADSGMWGPFIRTFGGERPLNWQRPTSWQSILPPDGGRNAFTSADGTVRPAILCWSPSICPGRRWTFILPWQHRSACPLKSRAL